jgi:hypothetical protein
MKKGKLGAILLALVLIIGLVCCIVCLEKIPAGYVGVVYNMNGGVDGEVLEQGWHLVAPTKKVTKYSIGIEQSLPFAAKYSRIHCTISSFVLFGFASILYLFSPQLYCVLIRQFLLDKTQNHIPVPTAKTASNLKRHGNCFFCRYGQLNPF